MNSSKKILAIGAHPDDLEFGCGGVLLKAKASGADINMVLSSLGESGSAGTPEQRHDEARKAAEMLGHVDGPVVFDFGGDGLQSRDKANVLKVARLIRDFKPTHVLAPSLVKNQHPDHWVVGEVTREACRLARFGGLKALIDLPVHRVDALAYYPVTTSQEVPFGERVCVDVSDVFDEWQKLMQCHHSQVSNRNYIELINARARQLGLSVGAEYAQELFLNDAPVVNDLCKIERTARSF